MSRNDSISNESNSHGSTVFEFGDYRMDTGQRLLTRDGEPIHLAPKTFDLLLFLVERSNRIVKKEEVFESVWNNSFVEDANLVVHVSALRKAFSSNGDTGVSIETFPKTGYRLNAEVRELARTIPKAVVDVPLVPGPISVVESNAESRKRNRFAWIWAGIVGLVVGAAASAWYFSDPGMRYNPVTKESYKGNPCPPDTFSPIPKVGRCEDPVAEFSSVNNPNGNWSYGFTPHNNASRFALFEHVVHGTHPTSPHSPVNVWHRPDEFQPQIVQNPTKMDVVIQGGIVLPPTMFEMHPGPDGQRSTVRWTAPAKGTYRLQGQFRGLNFSGYTNSDAAVVQNATMNHFTAHILGFNFEEPFDITLNADKGDTIDFSVGWGYKWYVGDSTGFSATIKTLSIDE